MDGHFHDYLLLFVCRNFRSLPSRMLGDSRGTLSTVQEGSHPEAICHHRLPRVWKMDEVSDLNRRHRSATTNFPLFQCAGVYFDEHYPNRRYGCVYSTLIEYDLPADYFNHPTDTVPLDFVGGSLVAHPDVAWIASRLLAHCLHSHVLHGGRHHSAHHQHSPGYPQ